MAYGQPSGPAVNGRGSAQAAPALADLGIPEGGVVPTDQSQQDLNPMSEIVKMLKGGQVGAERFLQLLSLLAASSVPQMDQAPQQQQPQQGMSGPGDIAGLLGG